MGSFCDWIMGLQGPALEAAVGVVLSYIVELWKGWAKLTDVAKRLVFLGVCLVIPLAAAGVGVTSCGQPATFETFWLAFLAGIAAFGTGTVMHTRILAKPRKSAPEEQ